MAKFTESPKLGNQFKKALIFAFESHQFQVRKSGEIPYFSHLMSVVALVLEAGGTEVEAISALLHDTIEDVGVSKEFLEEFFGSEVAEIVDQLSANSDDEYVGKILESSDSVKLISAADKLHNLRSYATPEGRSLWKSKHVQFYFRLIPIYRRCDCVPISWIDEMGSLLFSLRSQC